MSESAFDFMRRTGATTVVCNGKTMTIDEFERWVRDEKAPMFWELTIPCKLKSANSYVVNHGATRWQYKRDRDTWVRWLMVEKQNRNIPEATGKRHVEIVRLFSGRERLWDPDNLAASTKSLLDSLVLVRLLKADNAIHVSVDWSQERAEESGVRISIKEAA